jgi:hypothetical protein
MLSQISNLPHQWKNIAPHGRFSSCQPDLRDTLGNKNGRQEDNLRRCQQFAIWRQWHAFFGHAVDASQIAPLRDGNAQVVMLSVEGIGEEIGEGLRIADAPATRLQKVYFRR